MDQVLQTNIFFYITSVAVVIVTVLLAVALYYIIGILEDVRDVTDRVRRGSEVFAEDLSGLRDNIKEEGARVRHFAQFIGKYAGWYPAEKTKAKRTRKKKSEESGNAS